MPEKQLIKDRSNIVIGLTGPFGSGCSTLRKVLTENFDFIPFAISDDIRAEVQAEGRLLDKGKLGWRKVLQEQGDKRRQKNIGYWVNKVLERVNNT